MLINRIYFLPKFFFNLSKTIFGIFNLFSQFRSTYEQAILSGKGFYPSAKTTNPGQPALSISKDHTTARVSWLVKLKVERVKQKLVNNEVKPIIKYRLDERACVVTHDGSGQNDHRKRNCSTKFAKKCFITHTWLCYKGLMN